jgi:hypothetical protein
MASDYTNIQNKLISFTEVSSDVLSDTVTDYLLANAQNRIARDMDLDFLRKTDKLECKASDQTKKLPVGGKVIRHIHYLNGQDRVFLENKDISYLLEYNRNKTTTGKPKYYGKYDDNTLYISPTPSTNYTLEVAYTVRPNAEEKGTLLSSSNPYSWLSKNAENVLFYALMAEALVFLKGPKEMLQIYEGKYQAAAQTFSIEQMGRNRRDEYSHGVPRQVVRSQNPSKNP